MTKEEFNEWVRQMNIEADIPYYLVTIKDESLGKVIIIDIRTAKTGMSRCNMHYDKFNYNVGRALAYARLKGFEIPKIEEEPKFEEVEKGKKYYSIGESIGGKIEARWATECNTVGDMNHFENNNYFHTKERAEEVADKINFLLKLERLHDTFCPDHELNWDGYYTSKYCVYFDYASKKYDCDWFTVWCKEPQVYFPTREIAQKVCDVLNKEMKEE